VRCPEEPRKTFGDTVAVNDLDLRCLRALYGVIGERRGQDDDDPDDPSILSGSGEMVSATVGARAKDRIGYLPESAACEDKRRVPPSSRA
jgi:hypothetical protein